MEKDNIEDAINTAPIYSMRYMLTNEMGRAKENYQELQKLEADLEFLFLSDSDSDLKILTSIEKDQKIYLHMTNNDFEIEDFLILALNDWEQISIKDNLDYLLYKNEVGYKVIQPLDLSNIQPNSNYQLLLISNPFIKFDFYSNKVIDYTHRINIVK